MGTEIQIEGNRFFINGKPTYEGANYRGHPVEGLLFNSRMVQAIFDDENEATAATWRYPDTGVWDPDRNTNEFCAMLPEYRRHGLLGVTVGLQGGGSVYVPEVYENYVNSAFTPDGHLKPAYFDRLRRVLAAADAAGMVVIVNFFYWRQLDKMEGDPAIRRATEAAADWLLGSDFRNILVDVMNEFQPGEGLLQSGGIHKLIEIVQHTTLDGRRLLASSSIHPVDLLPPGRWQSAQDFYLPHGNDFWADQLRVQLQKIKASPEYVKNPRPLLMNEDSIHLDSLEAAVEEYASWGYYSQGYGCGGWRHGRFDWLAHERETRFEDLSGFQTVPVNWSINTEEKRAFFTKVAEITGCSI
ncbi:MAG: hypothetical protein EHM21_00020 [Chloroflexi bacterium]|nr:MAG: hypothetical protein EHM21_00020 [Chloroflexota bacterium]